MINSLFPLGNIVQTRAVAEYRMCIPKFNSFCRLSLNRHMLGIWGDLCPEDKILNDNAIHNGDRILSSYVYPDDPSLKIWIITEWDRSVTTILFPHEY